MSEPGEAGMEPEIVNDDYTPFLVPLWTRVRNPEKFAPVPDLFPEFSPMSGLPPHTQTSRVTKTGHHIVAYLPVLSVKAGEEIRVPIVVETERNITGMRVVFTYDPEVVSPVSAEGAGIPTESVFLNTKPSRELVGDLQNSLVAMNVFTYPWGKGGEIMAIRFKALKPGVSHLTGSLVEISSDVTFDLLPVVLRDGLIRVVE